MNADGPEGKSTRLTPFATLDGGGEGPCLLASDGEGKNSIVMLEMISQNESIKRELAFWSDSIPISPME